MAEQEDTKNQVRKNRAYAAGAQAACDQIKTALSPLIEAEPHRQQVATLIDNIRKSRFPMPPKFKPKAEKAQ